MGNYCELNDKEIARLRDELDMYFSDIKDELNLDCHPSTIARHYRKYKEKHKDNVLKVEVEGPKTLQDKRIKADPGPAREHVEDVLPWWKRFWKKVGRFFCIR